MNKIIEYIVQINSLNYNSQCIYTKKKLLSHDTNDIRHIIFFKKLNVILHKIPNYLSQLENKIGDKEFFLFSFWDELQDNTYFDDIKKDIQIIYIKLTDNIYQVRTLVKNSLVDVTSYININKKIKFLKNVYILMKTSVDATYITNTLSYIHLLPLDEQIEHFNNIYIILSIIVKEIVLMQLTIN